MSKDIFVSYSRKDEAIVVPIVERLEGIGYSVWIDRDGIESGDSFKRVIVRAIEECRVMLFFSSKSSNISTWTSKEVGVAVYEQKHIIPILLDDSKYNGDVKFDLINLDYIDLRQKNRAKQELQKLEDSLARLLGVQPPPFISQFGEKASVEPKASGEKPIGDVQDDFFKRLWMHKAEVLLGLAILVMFMSQTLLGCILACCFILIYIFGKRYLNRFNNKKVVILIFSISACLLAIFCVNYSLYKSGQSQRFGRETSDRDGYSSEIGETELQDFPKPIDMVGYIGDVNSYMVLTLDKSTANIRANVEVTIGKSVFTGLGYLEKRHLFFDLDNEDGVFAGELDGLLYLDGSQLVFKGSSMRSGLKGSPIDYSEFEFKADLSEQNFTLLTNQGILEAPIYAVADSCMVAE